MPRNAGLRLFPILVLALGLVLGLSLLAACVPAPPSAPAAGHPLEERIWSVREQRFVTADALADAMAGARHVMLGEIHDNPRHHALEAWAVRALAERSRRMALVAEMIAADQANALKIFYEEPRSDATLLRLFLDWDKSGWPDWTMYAPVFNAAILGNMRIHDGNLDRSLLPAMHETGWAALPDALRTELALPPALPEPVGPAMRTAIAAAHCGALPERVITPFAEIQFARDARMAMALMKAAGADGAILIAGSDHVRTDRGVPWHLRRLKARGPSLSIGFVETLPGKDRPQDYDTPYDYVWFTGGPHREPPCLRQALTAPS